MGHNICALIGKAPINKDKVREYGLAVAYENDFAIVILDWDQMQYWGGRLGYSTESHSEDIDWDCELSWFWAKELGWPKFAIIQTNYFAGMGEQSACLYNNAIKVIADTNINSVLEALGVVPLPDKDAFDTINLGEYRNTESYYWTTHNAATNKANMIEGKHWSLFV